MAAASPKSPRRKGARRQRSVLSSIGLGCLFVGALVAVCAAGWLGVTEYARRARETRTVEELAAGRGRWIQGSDARIYIQEWGDAGRPTVLLTHGTGAWSGTWFGLPQALVQAGWRVVAMDLPPFGLTRAAGAAVDYSRAAQARRVLDVVDALGVPVTLVGHSFGAGPALEAAMEGGDQVRQLVLVDPALGLGPDGGAPVCTPGRGGLLEARGLRTELVGATATWPGLTGTLLKQFVHRKDVVDDALVPAYQVPFERQGFTASLGDWAMAFGASACESARSLDPRAVTAWAAGGPRVSLIWGREDTVTPIAQAAALQRWMGQATLDVLPGVGHIPHIEAPAEFARLLATRVLRMPE